MTIPTEANGPAGSGKSTAARELAARLGFEYLDTGAMYRAVAVALARRGGTDVESILPELRIEMSAGRVLLNGEDVTATIRTPEASQGASKVAVVPAVRRFLAAEQRRIAAGRCMVCEGRDQGTFVFPDAAVKVFLTAEPQARAERRHRELLARNEQLTLADVLKAQEERDARDASRDLAPMRPAPDAILLDTTQLTMAEVLARLEEVIRRCPTART